MSKEKFRDWNPKGKINVRYWIDKEKGISNYWRTDAEQLFSQIDSVVEEFIGYDIKLTNRQLYYQLVGKDLIPNATEVYKRICTFLTDSRYGGLIDWEAIEDKGRVPEMHAEWDNVSKLIDSAVYSYRLPRWSDQEYYVELYCEKQAGETVLKPVAEDFHIYFGYNKGYSSASTMYDLSKRIAEQINDGKKVRILYFGDHDSSGLDMLRDIHARICEFLTAGDDVIDIVGYDEEPMFKVIPVALNMSQIKQYKCPPNPAKMTDPRAKWYVSKYGKTSWELDSLNPLVVRDLAEKAIKQFLDQIKFNAWIKKEEQEKKALIDFGKKLSVKKGDKD